MGEFLFRDTTEEPGSHGQGHDALQTFANSNSLTFLEPNNREMSNKDLGKLITEATVYLECHMTVEKLRMMIADTNSRKAFFSEFK